MDGSWAGAEREGRAARRAGDVRQRKERAERRPQIEWIQGKEARGSKDQGGGREGRAPVEVTHWCHMIQKGHVTLTATSCHPLTKAERFCRSFGNFFHHNLTLCAECFIRNLILTSSWVKKVLLYMIHMMLFALLIF